MYGMNFYNSNENVINITFYKYKFSLRPVTQIASKIAFNGRNLEGFSEFHFQSYVVLRHSVNV